MDPAELKLPVDFAVQVAKAVDLPLKAVQDICEFSEDKDGYFYARLKPKKYFEKPDFQKMCALVRELGGDNYLEGMKAWRVPGPFAKKSPVVAPPKIPEVPKQEIPNIKWIPIEAVQAPSFLPTRESISHEKLQEIRDSIKKHGLKYPIKVRPGPDPETYELIDGFLRLKSCQQLGWKEIPADIKETSDQNVVVESLITNKHRIEEDPITIAKKLDILVNAFGFTQERIAEGLGVSQPWVSDTIRFLKLPKEVQHYLALDNVSRYHALLLLTLESQDLQKKLAKQVVDEDLSTRQLENRIRELQPKPSGAPGSQAEPIGSGPEHIGASQPAKPESKVICAHCGEPIESGNCVNLEGQYYHQDCAEQVQAEKEPSLLPESTPGPFEKEPTETSEETREPEEGSKKTEELKAVQIGGFHCPECGKHFLVDHLPSGDHKLRLVRDWK